MSLNEKKLTAYGSYSVPSDFEFKKPLNIYTLKLFIWIFCLWISFSKLLITYFHPKFLSLVSKNEFILLKFERWNSDAQKRRFENGIYIFDVAHIQDPVIHIHNHNIHKRWHFRHLCGFFMWESATDNKWHLFIFTGCFMLNV